MSSLAPLLWTGEGFVATDGCDTSNPALQVADSWLVTDAQVLAIALHRERFEHGLRARGVTETELAALRVDSFWEAALAEIPPEGDWFPRVELVTVNGMPSLRFRLRPAPKLTRSLSVASHLGEDPRTAPTIKGPDLAAMASLRTLAQQRGADEAVLLTEDGYLSEGATTCLVWWRGDILCTAPEEFERVDSITLKTTLGMARALQVETHNEAVTPQELDGTELWALNALQGIRIVTKWLDGPELAERPGRLAQWRLRRERLRRPLHPFPADRAGSER